MVVIWILNHLDLIIQCGTGSNGVCGEHSRDCIEFEGNNPKILYNTAGCANVVCGSSTVARLKKASYTGLCNGNRRRFTRHHRDLQVEEEEKEEEAEARDIYVGDYEYDNEETKAEDFFFNAVMAVRAAAAVGQCNQAKSLTYNKNTHKIDNKLVKILYRQCLLLLLVVA